MPPAHQALAMGGGDRGQAVAVALAFGRGSALSAARGAKPASAREMTLLGRAGASEVARAASDTRQAEHKSAQRTQGRIRMPV